MAKSQLIQSVSWDPPIHGQIMRVFDILDGQIDLLMQPVIDSMNYFPADLISSFFFGLPEKHSEIVE